MFNINRACQHLRLLGYDSTESSRLSALVQKWHDNSGPEWTAKRLKSLEQFAKDRERGHANLEIPLGWSHKSTRKFKQRFSDDTLHRLFTSTEFDFEKAMHFARLSSGILMASKVPIRNKDGKTTHFRIEQMPPSKAQLDKTLTAIEGPADKELDRSIMESIYPYLGLSMKDYPSLSSCEPMVPMLYWPKTDTSAPYFNEDGKISTAPRDEDFRVWSLEIMYNDYSLARFMDKNLRYVTDCVMGKGDKLLPKPHPGSAIFSLAGGVLTFIQELGAKLRPVFSPFLVLQAINEPLKLQLKAISKTIPEIVTYDQDGGREILKQWMDSQTKVWSLDASSFTDRFPLEFQVKILELLVSSKKISPVMLDAFKVTTSHPAYNKHLDRYVHYTFGQGQGLGPSFNVATLAHYELLEAFRISLGLSKGLFRLVGDDVIIANHELAHSYMVWMDACNVEINLTKSIISNSLGEFAGSQITPKGIIKRPKLDEISSNDAVVSLFETYEQTIYKDRFISTMEEEYGKFARKFHLPADFGGKRHELVGFVKLKPLDETALQKARLIRDLKEFLPYSQKDVINFLINKEKIKAGILHSSHLYIDDPGLVDDKDYHLKEKEPISFMPALNKGQIQDVVDSCQMLLNYLKQCNTTEEILKVARLYEDIIGERGFLNVEGAKLNRALTGFQAQLSKLVRVDPLDITSNDAATRRKLKSRPTNTGWSKFMK
jgi:hypothetical protein